MPTEAQLVHGTDPVRPTRLGALRQVERAALALTTSKLTRRLRVNRLLKSSVIGAFVRDLVVTISGDSIGARKTASAFAVEIAYRTTYAIRCVSVSPGWTGYRRRLRSLWTSRPQRSRRRSWLPQRVVTRRSAVVPAPNLRSAPAHKSVPEWGRSDDCACVSGSPPRRIDRHDVEPTTLSAPRVPVSLMRRPAPFEPANRSTVYRPTIVSSVSPGAGPYRSLSPVWIIHVSTTALASTTRPRVRHRGEQRAAPHARSSARAS